jgi:hypothetical protein
MNDYPDNWPEIAKEIKEKARWHCEHCRAWHKKPGHVLTVHHIDMDKSNCDDNNLVALCQKCHLHWQHRFKMGQLIMSFALPDWLRRRGLGM